MKFSFHLIWMISERLHSSRSRMRRIEKIAAFNSEFSGSFAAIVHLHLHSITPQYCERDDVYIYVYILFLHRFKIVACEHIPSGWNPNDGCLNVDIAVNIHMWLFLCVYMNRNMCVFATFCGVAHPLPAALQDSSPIIGAGTECRFLLAGLVSTKKSTSLF